MKITNTSKNTLIAAEACLAKSIFSKMKGLLGRKGLAPQEALIIPGCDSIHTFFMRFPIDVLFVGKDGRVVKCAPLIKPFRLSAALLRAKYVIELTGGAIEKSKTVAGDFIALD